MSRMMILAGSLFLFSASAQAQFIPERGKLFMAAKYAELEQLVEKEIKDDPKPPSSKLMALCYAYGKLKRYNKLLPCLARLEGNIARGDTAAMDLDEMRSANPLLFGLAAMGSVVIGGTDALKGDVRPWLPLMYAEAYTELRDYDKAIAAAHQAFAAIPQRWNEERSFRIQALTALGLSHAFAGKKEEATKYAETLAEVSTSYPYTGLTDDKVMGVAKIYIALGDYKKAYEGMRADSKGPLGAIFMGLGDVIGGGIAGMGGESLFVYQELPKQFMVMKTQLEIGEMKQAKEGYDSLLAIPRVRDNGEIYWVLLYDRGRIAAAEGDLPGAVEFWKKAVDVIEQQRSTINTEANKIGFVGDKQAVYRSLIGGLFDTGQLAEAFVYLERSKSRALVDMLAAKKDFSVSSGNPEAISALLAKAEKDEMAALGQGAEKKSGTRSLAVIPTDALTSQAPELATLVSVSAIPLADIQSKIGNDEVLVEYYYDQQWLYAFVITRDHMTAVRQESSGLEAQVRAWRTALEDPKGLSQLPLAQELYQRLVTPVAAHLKHPRLTIISHGVLHYVPLAALHSGTEYLIDKYAIRHLPSASVMQFLRDGERAYTAGALVLGNPDLGDPRLDLAFAQEEAVAVASMVPNSRAFLRKEANAAALRKYAQGFRYLHFATHGEFKADSPLESALILSKDGEDDGLLTVNKLYSMRFDVNLVTLSACETGLGKIANGDDVVGLTRGFLYAGAATIVSSLWKVDDKATSDLMRTFYTQLSQQGKLDALRRAQLETKRKYPAPYFWAPFQLMGQPEGGQYVAAKVPEPEPTPPPVAKGKAAAVKKPKSL